MTATTPTPAHVALVKGLQTAAYDFAVAESGQLLADASNRLCTARDAILDALAQPALAAPVPQAIDIDMLADEILRIDGYGAMSPSELAEGLMPFILRRKAQQPTPAASPEPCFYTVFARHEGGGETGWIALCGFSNDTVIGVKDLVLQKAREESYKGTVTGYMMWKELEIRPVFEAPVSAQVMQPVEAIPKPCFMCHGAGWHWMSCAIPAGVEPPKPQKMKCTQCGVPAAPVKVAAPVAPIAPTTQFNDPRVQIVYDLLNSDDVPPAEQHWEGWIARRIVDALTAAKPQVLSDAQIDAATMAWFGTTDPHQAPAWRVHMRATIAAALAGGEEA